ncbi:MAG: polysaccharide pyruvyl transferase family protein [Clostridia bacterium]|nr:polysaccharide pyruvyl transferase family protein [Clostridia bacterium]
MKKIVLLGLLDTSNYGDTLICACTEKIIRGIIKDFGVSDISLVKADMLGEDYYAYMKKRKKTEAEFKTKIKGLRSANENFLIKYTGEVLESDELFTEETEKRHAEKLRRDRAEALDKSSEASAQKLLDENTAALIFFGGGLIKYGHPLRLGYCIAAYIRRAEELGIPVMFSATGVDGFDGEDEECAVMREVLNLNCVKSFTVRDDIDTLTQKFIYNENIRVRKAPCPTLMCKELFPMGTVKEGNTIGIGVIRSDKFTTRNEKFTEEYQLDFYKELIEELEKRGYEWKIFTNGHPKDRDFGVKILNHCGRTVNTDTLLPSPQSVHQLLDSYNMFDGIIASRFHVAVPSVSYNIPFVEFIWNVKQEFFAADAGLADRFTKFGGSGAADVVDRLEKAMKQSYTVSLPTEITVSELEWFIEEYVTMA